MKYLVMVIGLLVAAVAATFVRYDSLDPCAWLVHDAAGQSGLPPLAEETRIRAGFLVHGIAEPGPYDCLTAWWRLRSGAPGPGR